ncbi:uncharacterized protein LOC127968028 [Carassius gibelio]|uniref:uncharacterized protein LOC127968028 n=1 Tax=Carassius gibelio TaxID=101364 RepID=UPI0022780B0C|nr:uncharacterized protein LOC127968028 [Carassius gibelio]
MEQGRLGDYKGKSLDEIQVDVNETIDMEGPLAEDIEDVSMLGEDGSDDEVSMCHPRKNVPPHHKVKTRECLPPMSVCQEKRGQKMRSACHPCKNVPPHHKSKTEVCLQKREENKRPSKEAGPQTSVLQWTHI